MKWNIRLQKIYDDVLPNAPMADIGTDHAYLPIRLKQQGICPHVILCDVSEGSLSKAKADWAAVFPDLPADLRLGDGLTVLKNGEADTVVLAGMGGLLMREILGKDLQKTRSFKRFILQPRSHPGELRYWLLKTGFTIEREQLAREGKKYWEILTVSPSGEERPELSGAFDDADLRACYKYPDILAGDIDGAEEFLKEELEKLQGILSRRKKGWPPDTEETRADIMRLQSLMIRRGRDCYE